MGKVAFHTWPVDERRTGGEGQPILGEGLDATGVLGEQMRQLGVGRTAFRGDADPRTRELHRAAALTSAAGQGGDLGMLAPQRRLRGAGVALGTHLYDAAGVRIDVANAKDKYPYFRFTADPLKDKKYKTAMDVLLSWHLLGSRELRLNRSQVDQHGLWVRALLDDHSFWAQGRSLGQLRRMLAGSAAVASLWQGKRLVGFGRASSDGAFRAVLWDVVIPEDLQGQGLGRLLVEALLSAPALLDVERVYLMTTNSAGFYAQLGVEPAPSQKLLVITTGPSG